MNKILSNLTFRLVIGVIVGIVVGAVASKEVINVIVPIKYVLGQFIFFMVPLIILGFVTPSIAQLKNNASSLLTVALLLAYSSSVASAFFAMFLGYQLIPLLDIQSSVESLHALPELFFRLDIPPIMSVMSALILSLLLGLAVAWVKSDLYIKLLADFQKIVLIMVNRFLLPILPFFIATNFCLLSYEGVLNNQLPVFLSIILIIIVSHFIWLGILYGASGLYSGKNPWKVLKYYAPAYLTAVGTMSSAATLGVALKSAGQSPLLKKEVTDFGIPLFANIHLCGSILTETFFVMAVSQVLYGTLPTFSTMVIFVFLLAIFGIGAPGVPGGTVMASLGLVISILGFDEAGTALLLSIFALQDSFGTACNITGDGALTLILSTYDDKTNPNKIS